MLTLWCPTDRPIVLRPRLLTISNQMVPPPFWHRERTPRPNVSDLLTSFNRVNRNFFFFFKSTACKTWRKKIYMHRQALTINFYIYISVCYYKIVVGNKFVFFFHWNLFCGKNNFLPRNTVPAGVDSPQISLWAAVIGTFLNTPRENLNPTSVHIIKSVRAAEWDWATVISLI